MSAFREILYQKDVLPGLPSFCVSLGVTIVFALVTVIGSAVIAGTRTTGDLH
jgi:hypothetical protein